jgi:hypothetical protein
LNPFVRTRTPFGGLINDLRTRYSKYPSDIKVLFPFFIRLSGPALLLVDSSMICAPVIQNILAISRR